MEESLQNDTVASVAVSQESPVEENGKKMGVYVLIVLLVFSLLGLTYFVLKDNGIDILENLIGDTTDTQEDIAEENNDGETESNNTKECTVCTDEVSTDNNGWGLFSLPKYGFSVEIPTYRMMQSLRGTAGPQDIYLYWDVRHADYAPQDFSSDWYGKIHSELEHNVVVQFFPVKLPDGFACGRGCVEENMLDIYIFEKDSSENWTDIVNEYKDALTTRCPVGGYDCLQENDIEVKWEKDVLSYSIIAAGGAYNGYVVSNDSYIFNIVYYIDSSSSESKQIAQRVLDSMKFE